MIQEDLKKKIKELTTLINTYIKDKKITLLVDISMKMANYFDAQTVYFWILDDKNKQIQQIDTDQEIVICLEDSLMQLAIENKTIIFENHVTSNKYYNQKIDNPLKLKIKSLMLFPIVKDKKVIAIVTIFREVGGHKIFTKTDEKLLYTFAPILLKMFELEYITKKDLLQLLKEKGESKSTHVKKIASSIDKGVDKSSKYSDNLAKLENEIIKLKEENKAYREQEKYYKKSINTKDNEIKQNESKNKENELILQSKIDKYDKELASVKVKYNELEDSFSALYTESNQYQSIIKALKKDLQLIQEENIEFQKSLKKKANNIKSIQELKSEISLLSQTKVEERNIEFILQRIENISVENKHVYILFELMTYAFSSKKGIFYIEEILEKSKVVQKILDGYYFKRDVNVYNEKYRISDMVKHIERFENKIFSKMFKFNISVAKTMPSSLVFDALKIETIILHLLIDLHQFMENNQDVNIHFGFKKKLLYIEIGGDINQKNNLFKKMFKTTKLSSEGKDRIRLQLCKKIIARLKGTIDIVYEDAYYKFIVTVPTQVIKM